MQSGHVPLNTKHRKHRILPRSAIDFASRTMSTVGRAVTLSIVLLFGVVAAIGAILSVIWVIAGGPVGTWFLWNWLGPVPPLILATSAVAVATVLSRLDAKSDPSRLRRVVMWFVYFFAWIAFWFVLWILVLKRIGTHMRSSRRHARVRISRQGQRIG